MRLGWLLLAFILLAVPRALTKAPWVDEGEMGNASHSFLHNGYLAMTSIDPDGHWSGPLQFLRVHRYYYWLPPGFPLLVAFWWKLWGEGLITARLLSIVWGVAGIAGIYVLARCLTNSERIAWLAALLTALNYHFLNSAAVARPDMIETALGIWSLAVYLILTDRGHPAFASAVAHALLAIATLMHPNAIIFFPLLLFLMARSRRLRPADLAAAAGSWIFFLGLWGIYIAQDTEAFRAQFAANLGSVRSGDRLGFFAAPLHALVGELARYSIGPQETLLGALMRPLLTLPWLAAAALVALHPRLRKTHATSAILILGAAFFLTAFVGRKWDGYLVNVAPFYCLAIAICLAEWKGTWPRLALTAILAINLLGTAWEIWKNPLGNDVAPVMAVAKEQADPSQPIYASAEAGFFLGFERINDDYTLGAYSGRVPSFFLLSTWYVTQFQAEQASETPVYFHMAKVLSESRELIRRGKYGVYEHR